MGARDVDFRLPGRRAYINAALERLLGLRGDHGVVLAGLERQRRGGDDRALLDAHCINLCINLCIDLCIDLRVQPPRRPLRRPRPPSSPSN